MRNWEQLFFVFYDHQLQKLYLQLKVDKVACNEHQIIDMADANAIQEVDIADENLKEIDPLDVSNEENESCDTAG